MRHIFILVNAVLLAGCAARTPYVEPPVVDMAGVDQNRYNNDLSACTNEKIARNADTVWTNGIISECMTQRGYKVLTPKG